MNKDDIILMKIAITLTQIKHLINAFFFAGICAVFAFDIGIPYWKTLGYGLLFLMSIALLKQIYLRFKTSKSDDKQNR